MSKQNEIETQILIALFNATCEQMEMLSDAYKHQTKQALKKFVTTGNNFQRVIDRQVDKSGMTEDYEAITDVIHSGINELRKRYKDLDNSKG